MKILWLATVIAVMLAGICYSIDKSGEKMQEKLLRSNFAETPCTAWVKIVDVQKKGSELLYPTYLFICDVKEIFKGERLQRIDYLRGFEEPFKKPVQELFVGKSFIVSLQKNDNGQYYMGDNGYALDDSPSLLTVARKLSQANIAASFDEVNGRAYTVKIGFNKPDLDNARAFCSAAGSDVFYSRGQNYFYVRLSAPELKERLGLELAQRVVPRAGNSTNTDACFYDIKDMKGLKAELRPLVREVRVENDPKFELYDDAVSLSGSTKKFTAAESSAEVGRRLVSECSQQPECRHVVALENASGEIGGYCFQPSVMDAPISYYDRKGDPLTVFHIFAPDDEKNKASKIIQRLRAQYPIEHPL